MLKGNHIIINLIFVLLSFLTVSRVQAQKKNSYNQAAANENGNKGGAPLEVTSYGTLNFGKFSRINGGRITISPVGSISTTGDIFLVNSTPSPSVASFDISTNSGATKMVNVTSSNTVLTGAGSLELSVEFDQSTFSIDKNNPVTVLMGGTLTVGPEDLPGNYSGTVNVTFDYQ
jgi:hypothetical protein